MATDANVPIFSVYVDGAPELPAHYLLRYREIALSAETGRTSAPP